MPICSECENPLDFDEEDVDEGDVVVCDECGTEFEVVAIDPIELAKVDEDYDEEDEVFSEDEEEEE
uniref:Lysine biosynthesis protein LysW n=1 Tax=Acidobacterium capsulatum TaxID=33075 RepID=A0A7V4XQY4_9BACT